MLRASQNAVRHRLLIGVAALALFGAAPALAQELSFDIPVESLSAALRDYARISGRQILFSESLVRGRTSPPLKGRFTSDAALANLLEGSGLVVQTTASGAVMIVERPRARVPAPDPAAESDATTVSEVIVTSAKRAEPLQKVPMSVRALTQRALQDQGADQFTDYYRSVPGLTLQERSPGFNTISIRGVVSLGSSTAATAGVYLDDIPVSSEQFQSDLKLVDVERVEVLRGPQGTLYGEGSMGGTVRIITNKPDPNGFSAEVAVRGSRLSHGGEGFGADATVNIPVLSGKAALRLVGYHRDEPGWIDNVATGRNDVNDEITDGARASLRLAPLEGLTLTLTALHQRQAVGGAQTVDSAFGPYRQYRNTVESSRDRYDEYNLSVEKVFEGATLLSSTSYFDRDFAFSRDLQVLADIFGGETAAIEVTRPTRTFTQELRLSSSGDGAWRYLVGLYFERRSQSDFEAAVVNFPPALDYFTADSRLVLQQKAVFGEVSYAPDARLRLTLGLRGFDEDQRITVAQAVFGAPEPTFRGKLGSKGVTPKFAVDYQINPDRLVYFQASQGYRSGGVNVVTGPGVPQTFDPDHLWNYELGYKTYLFDRKASLNLAAFYIDWKDIQISVPDPNVVGLAYLANAGAAFSRGLEAELSVRPSRNVDFGATLGYDDAQLKALVQNGSVIYARSRMPNVPRLKASAFLQYSHPVVGDLSAYGRVDVSYTGESPNVVRQTGNVAPKTQDAYGLANIRGGLRWRRLQLEGFVDNLFDERAQLYIDPNLSVPGDAVVTINRPRSIGLLLRARF